MAIISGIDIPNNKRGLIALTYIFGIGLSTSKKIFKNTGIDENLKVSNWSDDNLNKIRKYISSNLKIEGELKFEIQLDIKRMIEIGCYRGIRHRIGLPVRGQKTKNNCRTRKGKKKTVANKKKKIKS
ncbi:30S ribosomal protein S13 [Candidatus Karelsulcia muelleri]|uniref:Small ribosomal subunit protein uS13 n=1 Tax=Candidatus Karelsulcia muelleri PSPU TaxID=1189303 RepID=A0AAD1AY74_9FLAO|nr:30S ribosomal protein S13 [Candidatus Karelsulcia muelleri]NJJ98756.1 30S ribosomal protein S13 [Candidatus Karelsulcia muelleri]BAO66408.1 30S ribosomal protein S13 [Candidatus Karelsulcia muelleri PSPU]